MLNPKGAAFKNFVMIDPTLNSFLLSEHRRGVSVPSGGRSGHTEARLPLHHRCTGRTDRGREKEKSYKEEEKKNPK